MALHWRPVGPEPDSTYWLRRAGVAAAAVVVLVLLLSLLTGGEDAPDELASAPASSAPSSSAPASGAPASSAPVAPSAGATPAASAATAAICPPDALLVEALVDDESYAVGSSPKLSLRVTNRGTTPCTRDLGQSAIELLVFSGRDRIWSSDDCAPGGSKDVTVLAPGEAVTRRATWSGTRSLPACEGSKAQAEAGTYRVVARVGQLRVEGDAFQLTD